MCLFKPEGILTSVVTLVGKKKVDLGLDVNWKKKFLFTGIYFFLL